MNFHSECPGVYTQDFKKNRFAVFMIAKIEPEAYYSDIPIELNSLKPGFSESIDQQPRIYLDGNPITDYYVDEVELSAGIEVAISAAVTLADELRNINDRNITALDLSCPPGDLEGNPPAELFDIEIQNAEGELIDLVQTDLNSRETSNCSEYGNPEMIATFMNQIPTDLPHSNDPIDKKVICSLPEGYLKTKLLAASDGTIETIEDFQSNIDSLDSSISNYVNQTYAKMGINPQDLPTTAEDWIADGINNTRPKLLEDIEQWYGIPLIELDAGQTGDGSDAIIIQINTKKNWVIDVLNLGAQFNDPEMRLEMSTSIPPGVEFIVGFITDGVNHTLVSQLLIPGSPIESKTIRKPHKLSINSFGCDTKQLKNLCGYIYDIYVWDWAIPEDIKTIVDNKTIPPFPFGALAFYDFYNTRVIYNSVHEQRGFLKPCRIGGVHEFEWTTFDDSISEDWKFMQNGHLEDFFCRNSFLHKDFSIIWHHQIEEWGLGRQYLISDDINHNYLYYDYFNFEFVLKFNNTTHRFFHLMRPKTWAQYSLRHKYFDNNGVQESLLEISIVNFNTGIIRKAEFNIGVDFEFELMSMLARYDAKSKNYMDKFKGSFGMLMLFDKYIIDDFLIKFKDEQAPVIKTLQPYN